MDYYKIGLLNAKNILSKYYVFSGEENLPELSKIFSTEELQTIEQKNIEIINVSNIIHVDDTIETIKKKNK